MAIITAAMMLLPATASANFATSNHVGAARNTDGSRWMVVLQDSTHIRVGYIPSGGSLVMCLVAGFLPAWTASKLKPVEALRS